MAFKCLCYFVLFKKGPHDHNSICMTVHSESQMCKDHFTAGCETEIMRTDAQYTCRRPVSEHSVQLGSFIYTQRGGY